MKKYINLALLMAISVGLCAQTFVSEHIMTAADSAAYDPAPTVKDISWLAGSWRGSGLGGDIEEIWSEPLNGHMIGLFRYDQGGELGFTEHCYMSDTPAGVRLRLKHFSADLKGWEAADEYEEFALIKMDGQTAYFNGATISRSGDKLIFYVWISSSDGSAREELFEYYLQD